MYILKLIWGDLKLLEVIKSGYVEINGHVTNHYPAGIYCSKLTIETPEQGVNFEQI